MNFDFKIKIEKDTKAILKLKRYLTTKVAFDRQTETKYGLSAVRPRYSWRRPKKTTTIIVDPDLPSRRI